MTTRAFRPVPDISDRRLREAFEHAAAGVSLADLDGHYLEVNRAYCNILGRSVEETKRETIMSVTHPDDRERTRVQLERLISGKIPSFVIEKRCLRPDGSVVWVRKSVSVQPDDDGRPIHIISICEDITEHHKAEHALREHEQLAILGRLAASIVHEINNPLEAVTNLLYLAGIAPSWEDSKRYLNQAEFELRRVSQITMQTLRFHREQSNATETDVAELLESVLALYGGKLKGARVDLRFERNDCPTLICFPGEMRQIFANIIANAIDAMPAGGRLRARVGPARHWRKGLQGVRITIGDTGTGMDPATLKRIYEPFFTTKGNSGNGLGLWVTADKVNKHSGEIRVRSRNTGHARGTVFSLMFPYTGAEGKELGSDAA